MLSFLIVKRVLKTLSKYVPIVWNGHGTLNVPKRDLRLSWLFYLPMNKNLTKTIPIVCLLSFIFIDAAFTSTPLKNFQIPSQFGTIKEIFEASHTNSSLPAIIQIQDAHCNYEAQKNLARILDYLAAEKKLRLIMVEGGSGDVGLSFLRDFADQKSREEVAEKYLRTGKISGEEYLDIVSDYNLELYGIEDPALYDTNLDSFLNIEAYKEEGLSDIAKLKDIVDALKPHMYNRELLRMDSQKSAFADKTLPLAEYCIYLTDAAGKKDIALDEYKQLSSFRESLALEKTIDFKQAEAQRGAFIKDLAQKMQGALIKELIAKTADFKDKKISAQEYYEFLRTAAQDRLDLKEQYPQFDAYMRYVALGRDIDAEKLLKEISRAEDRLSESLFVSNDERHLSGISDSLGTLRQFLRLDLTPGEYAAMKKDPSRYVTASWINFLTDRCRRYRISARPSASLIIDENFDALDSFYQVGIDREQAFMRNIAQKISAAGDNGYVVVITGGFHTSGLSRLFKEQGYSYAVVTPAISRRADPAIYYSVLRGENGEFEDTYLAED